MLFVDSLVMLQALNSCVLHITRSNIVGKVQLVYIHSMKRVSQILDERLYFATLINEVEEESGDSIMSHSLFSKQWINVSPLMGVLVQ